LTSRILYKSSVSRDLRKIAPKDVDRILKQIRTVLGENPQSGEQLHGDFEGLLKLRVGEYRVVYALSGDDIVVLMIRHRAKAYV
jgi:mRNA interferase RelE/StbE